jgi:hypothetical protein
LQAFWSTFKAQVPRIDILIDDGGHERYMQKATLDAIWGHLSPGGVYLCEDVHGGRNPFAQDVFGRYVTGKRGINDLPRACFIQNVDGVDQPAACPEAASARGDIQTHLAAASFYPYMIVLEKRRSPLAATRLIKQGTVWQPPLDEFISGLNRKDAWGSSKLVRGASGSLPHRPRRASGAEDEQTSARRAEGGAQPHARAHN